MLVGFRRAVYDLLREKTSIPVFRYLPDDVAHLPCHVVGRVGLRPAGTPAVGVLELTVNLVGRRISDDDAQAELDALADELIAALGGTRQVVVDGGALWATGVDPGTVVVAGQEFPAYLATVNTETLTC